jgi:hypothetical protein
MKVPLMNGCVVNSIGVMPMPRLHVSRLRATTMLVVDVELILILDCSCRVMLRVHIDILPNSESLLLRTAKATMIWFWLAVTRWSHCVLTQPLEAGQHTALMSLYDGLGLSFVDIKSCGSWFFFFFFQDATQQRAHDSLRRRIALAQG